MSLARACVTGLYAGIRLRHCYAHVARRTLPGSYTLARTSEAPSNGRLQKRCFADKSQADAAIEDITELYATAQDEFEIAMEETEKVSVYAEDDRKAAREELEKVQEAYNKIVEGPDADLAEQVKRRIGQRIRELDQGVKRMEELAMSTLR